MIEQLRELEKTGLVELAAASDADALERWRVRYLGTKGLLKGLMPRMKEVPGPDKPAVGKQLNEVKRALEAAFEKQKLSLAADAPAGPEIDVTEPGLPMGQGCSVGPSTRSRRCLPGWASRSRMDLKSRTSGTTSWR
jgi:phenylalanyl-tRNA synthetase alpha chain